MDRKYKRLEVVVRKTEVEGFFYGSPHVRLTMHDAEILSGSVTEQGDVVFPRGGEFYMVWCEQGGSPQKKHDSYLEARSEEGCCYMQAQGTIDDLGRTIISIFGR